MERLRQKTDEKTEIEKLISVEELNSSRMPSEDEIAFFLHQLKNSKADDLRSRKALISTFINAIYLYDDRLTLILTIDGETVNISDPLLNTIEDGDEFFFELIRATILKTEIAVFYTGLSVFSFTYRRRNT